MWRNNRFGMVVAGLMIGRVLGCCWDVKDALLCLTHPTLDFLNIWIFCCKYSSDSDYDYSG